MSAERSITASSKSSNTCSPLILFGQFRASLFPTIMKLTGAAMPTDRVYDGFDMSGILFGTGEDQRKVMFYYSGKELFAARKGAFKAHFTTWPGYAKEKPEKHDPPLLYNVEQDPGEKFDVAKEHPEVIANIRAEAAISSFFSAVRVAMCLSLVMIAIPALDTAGIH